MVRAKWPLSTRAASLGSYPSLWIAARTRAAVLGLTRLPPFTTRETVMVPTPHARATSVMVGLADRFLGIAPPETKLTLWIRNHLGALNDVRGRPVFTAMVTATWYSLENRYF